MTMVAQSLSLGLRSPRPLSRLCSIETSTGPHSCGLSSHLRCDGCTIQRDSARLRQGVDIIRTAPRNACTHAAWLSYRMIKFCEHLCWFMRTVRQVLELDERKQGTHEAHSVLRREAFENSAFSCFRLVYIIILLLLIRAQLIKRAFNLPALYKCDLFSVVATVSRGLYRRQPALHAEDNKLPCVGDCNFSLCPEDTLAVMGVGALRAISHGKFCWKGSLTNAWHEERRIPSLDSSSRARCLRAPHPYVRTCAAVSIIVSLVYIYSNDFVMRCNGELSALAKEFACTCAHEWVFHSRAPPRFRYVVRRRAIHQPSSVALLKLLPCSHRPIWSFTRRFGVNKITRLLSKKKRKWDAWDGRRIPSIWRFQFISCASYINWVCQMTSLKCGWIVAIPLRSSELNRPHDISD